ncbi:MAG: helix-turn-helix domain-containing protein [Bacteroidales bacterium]
MTGSLQVGMVRHSAAYASQGANPPGTLTILMPVDEERPFVHRGHEIGPMQTALTRSGEGFECLCRSGAHFVAASVAQERIERYAADLWQVDGLWRESKDRLAFADPARLSRYRDACLRILGAVNEQPGVFGDRRAAALLEEKFLETLLLNAHAAPSSAHDAHRYGLAREAYRLLQDRADEVLSIREICAATKTSYTTLEKAFRETYGMTPKAMMTAMRLSGVRRALLHSDPTTNISATALRWGFVELGRFSAQYRQRYGEVPSETLRRTRR